MTGDEIYGDDADLRRWLEARGHPYVLAVACSHTLWHGGHQERADTLVVALPAGAWATFSAEQGSQGERLDDWAGIHLPYPSLPGMAQWLLARRRLSEPTEIASFRVFGPGATAVAELVRVAGLRWAIEESFEEAKGAVVLDQYEVRK